MRRKPLTLAALAGVVAAALLIVPAAEAQELAPAAGTFRLPEGATPVGECPGLDGKPVATARRGSTAACFVQTPPGVSTAPAGSLPEASSATGTRLAPDWCSSINSYWITMRFESCRQEHGEFVLYVLDPITGFPHWLGTMNVIFVLHQKTSARSSTFDYKMEIRTGGATIGAQRGVSIWGWFECQSWSCLLLHADFPFRTLLPHSSMTATGTFETGLNGFNDVRWAYTAATFRAQPAGNPAGITDGATFPTGAQVRCDSALSGLVSGCVYDIYRTNFFVDSSRWPAVARHVRLAQESGLPWLLRRLTDPSAMDKNGRRACARDKLPPEDPGLPFPPPGTSCDEYPPRSTYEGAEFAFQLGGKPRTFDGCSLRLPRITGPGWSACMVPHSQNIGEGGALGSFYNNNRVLDWEQFTIGVS